MADRRFNLPGEPARVAETAPAVATTEVTVAQVDPEEQATVAEVVPVLPEVSDETEIRTPAPVPEPAAGQGGPLLPAAPAEVSSPPAKPVEPSAPVLREAAIDEVAPAARPAPVAPPPTGLPDPEVPPVTPEMKPPIGSGQASLPGSTVPVAPPPVQATPETTRPPAAQVSAAAGPALEAAGDEPRPSAPTPAVAAPMVLAPTIDAIELEGASSFISGSGPAGAVIRLYSDGQLLGESPVEEGRWLIEAGNILGNPSNELRAQAIEPETGKQLGESVITIEIELPSEAPPGSAPSEPPPSEAEPPLVSAPPPDPQSPPQGASELLAPLPDSAVLPGMTETDGNAPSAETAAPAEIPIVEEEVGPVEPPTELPPISPTVPRKTSPSVEMLPRGDAELESLPSLGVIDNAPATIGLDPPDGPALMAEFSLPKPGPHAPSVTVLRLFPFGDPVYGRFSGGQAIIRRGDTLWSLARRYYGAGIHYRTIFKANRDQISRPSKIFPGQVFDLPIVMEE